MMPVNSSLVRRRLQRHNLLLFLQRLSPRAGKSAAPPDLKLFSSTPAGVDIVNGKLRPPTSLAKVLASLEEDSSRERNKKKPLTRMELKRLLENRIKKRIKDRFSDGRFHNLMDSVICSADTLRDAYDIIRLDSNVDLSSPADDLCFSSIAGELAAGGGFNVAANTLSVPSHRRGGRPLVLPNVKLRTIQEAIRVSLEIVHRPHFSKLSHGCRGGRGHSSARNFISRETGNDIDWWFTIPMDFPADMDIISKLISILEEKIEDARLFSFIRELFRAEVLNLKFGGFPKGHGLPQEGVLSPILINVYLHELDLELERIFMKYECFGEDEVPAIDPGRRSKLRDWVRRRIGGAKETGSTFLACRVMDEVMIAGRGSMETAGKLRDEVAEFLRSSLYIQSAHPAKVLPIDCPNGLQFLGVSFRIGDGEKTRAVHKLRDKVRAFSSMKMEAWETLMVRLGKKWLAHGLRKLKESEIRPLRRSTPTLDRISCFRKQGMKTDHWFKILLKVWLQDAGAAAERSEEAVLGKLVAEPAMPDDLRRAFYGFMNQAEGYLQAEEESTLHLLSQPVGERRTVAVEAPVRFIRRRLVRYGLVDSRGNPRCVRDLVLQDDALIVLWFAGLVRRWRRWFAGAGNFQEIEAAVSGAVRRSCVRTLAVKHRMSEAEVERRFAEELDCSFLAEEDPEDQLAGAGEDEALAYGVAYSGLCLLSLEEVSAAARCSVVGCPARSPGIYAVRRKESQSFPGWKTGFSPAIFSGLEGRRIALCKTHAGDLYSGFISLRSIDFQSLT